MHDNLPPVGGGAEEAKPLGGSPEAIRDLSGTSLRDILIKSVGTAVCLVGLVTTWVAMAEILQSVQEKGGASYDKVRHPSGHARE